MEAKKQMNAFVKNDDILSTHHDYFRLRAWQIYRIYPFSRAVFQNIHKRTYQYAKDQFHYNIVQEYQILSQMEFDGLLILSDSYSA